MEELESRRIFTIYQENIPVGKVEWDTMALPINATPEDKLLLIIGRIFIEYLNDDSDTLLDHLFRCFGD